MTRSLLFICFLFLLGCGLAVPLSAESIPLPGLFPAKPRAAGFRAVVAMEAAPTHGYQPLHIDFMPLGRGFPRQRRLQLTISPRGYSESDLDFDQQLSVVLPEGAPSHRVTVLVPYYFAWDRLILAVSEDRRLIDQGITTFPIQNIRLQTTHPHTTVGILRPRDVQAKAAPWKRFPDIRTLTTVLGEGPIPETPKIHRLSDTAAAQEAKSSQPAQVQYRTLEEDRLFTNWLGYSQLDVILVPGPLTTRIRREQPEHWQALQDWVQAGGNLWIYAAEVVSEPSFSTLPRVAPNAALSISTNRLQGLLQLSQQNDTSGWNHTAWRGAYRLSEDYGWQTNPTNQLRPRRQVYQALQAAQHPFADPLSVEAFGASVRHGGWGLGTVTTMESVDPFPGSFLFWESIARLHGPDETRRAEGLQWVSRHGLNAPAGNRRYWSFLIESVGQPPVKWFVLLNTLFAFGIGPVCYFLLRRRDRLYLLFFVAPAVALLVTGSLFAYAVLADGIRTRAQTKTLTWVDAAHDSVCRESHHAYFSVFGQTGLRFPSDSLVVPLKGMPQRKGYYQSGGSRFSGRTFAFADHTQRFDGDFLPSRDQVQYYERRPVHDQPSPRFQFDAAAGEGSIENPFPYALRRLLVHQGNGRYWVADSIAADGEARLQPASRLSVRDFLDSSLLDDVLFLPTGQVPTFNSWNQTNRSGALGSEISQLDARLKRWAVTGLPPGHFIAVAETPNATLALEAGSLVDEIHVVMGNLP
jgi:hypothetical protein